jgi:hypothetical protein
MIRRFLASGALGAWLVGDPEPALAAPPQISNIAPAGVQRGVPAEVTISGSNLAGNPRLIAPFDFKDGPRLSGSSVSSWKTTLAVSPDTAVAVYPIRVQTDEGISNPFLLAVGQLPQVVEKEDNSFFESAQLIPDPPLVVEGEIAGNDVDYFRFHGKKGQKIVVDAQCGRIGSGVDPSIRLTTAAAETRSYLASADDSPGLLSDARLTAELPEDTDYVVEISDSRYQGTARPAYRLLIGAVPMAEEIYPLGGRVGETVGLELRGGTLSGMKPAAATLRPLAGTDRFPPRITSAMLGVSPTGKLTLDVESLPALAASIYPELREPSDPAAPPVRAVAPVVFNGRINPAGDVDRFVLAVSPGEKLRIAVQASEFGSALDALLRIRGNDDTMIANADDTNVPLPVRKGQQPQTMVLPDPSLELTVPGRTGQITLEIRDLEGRGGAGFPYRIVVEPAGRDFELVLDDSQVAVPRNGTATMGVTVRRKGFDGPIGLAVTDPPAGLSVRGGEIAAGQTAGVLSLTAASDATFAPFPLNVIGRAAGGGTPIERRGFKELVFVRQASFPINTLTQYGLVVAPGLSAPVRLETPGTPIEVPRGLSATLPVKVVRTKGADGALSISAPSLPPGVTLADATLAKKATQGTVTVKAALQAALGTTALALQAKGKIAGSEHTLALPLTTLRIVHPASLALEAGSVEARPGSTVEVKGKVVRKGLAVGPITVKINGLPAGVNSDPVIVAEGVSSFMMKLSVDSKAATSTTATQVALSFQLEKKDYTVPPAPLVLKVLGTR